MNAKQLCISQKLKTEETSGETEPARHTEEGGNGAVEIKQTMANNSETTESKETDNPMTEGKEDMQTDESTGMKDKEESSEAHSEALSKVSHEERKEEKKKYWVRNSGLLCGTT